jgi:hypothetical protein
MRRDARAPPPAVNFPLQSSHLSALCREPLEVVAPREGLAHVGRRAAARGVGRVDEDLRGEGEGEGAWRLGCGARGGYWGVALHAVLRRRGGGRRRARGAAAAARRRPVSLPP